ncbi:hypothetical protein Cgig2_005433 [Carnegiea gigantea]|uniref:Argonaute 4 n=1 Tax=Carnegiea gigantea TaxID=171969 RepID=A0A9Q1KD99_9CARY|nr:hypothetical protein Cgig2_005433 [Carnegiea gigantea]
MAEAEQLPPPPPTVPPGVTPVKAEEPQLTKKSDSPKLLPMVRRGGGSRGQRIQLLTNHFPVKMPSSDGYFYHYCVCLCSFFHYLRFLHNAASCHELIVGPHGSPGGRESPDDGSKKRLRRPQRTKSYKVDISYATKIPLQAIANALRGQDSEQFQEAVRVLDIVLRQHAARQGCLLVRQSFFHDEPRRFEDIGGGVLACRGFHSSFRATQAGLSLNMDVSTTMIVKPGPVVDFLIANQNVRDPYQIDWAKKQLKERHKLFPVWIRFEFRERNNGGGEVQSVEITVFDYFVNYRHINITFSGDFPCINVGKPKKPTYLPLELCELVSLQRYTKALSGTQRATLVEKSRQKPDQRMRVLTDALRTSNYGSDPLLRSSGIQISNQFAKIDGRLLSAPKLRVGNGEDFFPRNGRWNFNNKTLFQATDALQRWAIVNFSARCDVNTLIRDMIKCGERKGMRISNPHKVFAEDHQNRRFPAPVRVDKMIETVKNGLPGPPQLLLCILPERKNCDIYGPWKRRNLADLGVVTQCIAPTRLNDQYLTNVLLKINCKLGGLNSTLSLENARSIPLVSSVPTLIIGMDVSHGSPGRADVPSIAAVELPFFQCVLSILDGVSESQFNQVLNIEFDQIKQLSWVILSGTVIENTICHPKNNDFYMCAHAGMIGTTRPTHYHVLHDEIGFSADDLQELVHSLSYVYQRSTTAISVVAPICYAHLAASQVGQFLKFDDMSDTSSGHGSITSVGSAQVTPLPRLHKNVMNSMFFC